MPLDLHNKEELMVYALHKWQIKHIAANYLDIVYDSLQPILSRDEKLRVLRRLIDWWPTPQYLEILRNDYSAQNVLNVCTRRAKEIEIEILDERESTTE